MRKGAALQEIPERIPKYVHNYNIHEHKCRSEIFLELPAE